MARKFHAKFQSVTSLSVDSRPGPPDGSASILDGSRQRYNRRGRMSSRSRQIASCVWELKPPFECQIERWRSGSGIRQERIGIGPTRKLDRKTIPPLACECGCEG